MRKKNPKIALSIFCSHFLVICCVFGSQAFEVVCRSLLCKLCFNALLYPQLTSILKCCQLLYLLPIAPNSSANFQVIWRWDLRNLVSRLYTNVQFLTAFSTQRGRRKARYAAFISHKWWGGGGRGFWMKEHFWGLLLQFGFKHWGHECSWS